MSELEDYRNARKVPGGPQSGVLHDSTGSKPSLPILLDPNHCVDNDFGI